MSKYTESDAAYYQSKKSDPEFKARRAAHEKARRDRLRAQGISPKSLEANYKAKNGVSYYERGTTCFPGISTALVKSRTAHNWKKAGIKFTSQEHFDYWANRYNNATACEISGNLFIDGNAMLRKCLDHDHKTGLPRGVINGKHNLTIGHLEDVSVNVVAVLKYLL
jgi:Recombination endonuclease VII